MKVPKKVNKLVSINSLACRMDELPSFFNFVAALLFFLFFHSLALVGQSLDQTPLILNEERRYNTKGYVEYYEDEERKYNVAEVTSSSFKNSFIPDNRAVYNLGFSRSFHWLHFKLRNDNPKQQLWYLKIAYPILDSVLMQYSSTFSPPIQMQAGDLKTFYQGIKEGIIEHPEIVFPLELKTGMVTDVYLRIYADNSIVVPISILSPNTFFRETNHDFLSHGAFFGIYLALIIYNLILFFSLRDKSYLFLALLVLSVSLYFASMEGYSRQYIWPDSIIWGNMAPSFFLILSIFFLLLFTCEFIKKIIIIGRLFRNLLFLFLWLSGLLIVLIAFMDRFLFNQAISLFSFTTFLLLGGIMISLALKGDKAARIYLTAMAMFLIVGAVNYLRTLRIIDNFSVILLASQISFSLMAIFFSRLLNYQLVLERGRANQFQELQRMLFEKAGEGICLMSAEEGNEGIILNCNVALAAMHGFTQSELIGKHILEINSEESAQGFPTRFKKIIQGEWIREELIYRDKNRRLFPVSISAGIIEHEDKKLILSFIRDISNWKKQENDLKIARNRAEESDRLKTAFVTTMSHELRTPLNAIIGYSDLMLKANSANETREQLLIIRNSAHILLSQINDILELSKLQAGFIKSALHRCSIKNIMKEMHSVCQMLIQLSGKPLICSMYCDDQIQPEIMGDSNRLKQVLTHLINNAVKFTCEGRVEFGVRLMKDKHLEFFIRDTGKGIPIEKQLEIFQPFHQEDGSYTRKHGGTGLGLTIVEKLVELLQGKLHLESSTDVKNHGTTFYFSIPYIPMKIKNAVANTNNLLSAGEPKLILVVEDDSVSQTLAKDILLRNGYKVLTADNGIEAVNQFKQNPEISLILMDIQMPEMDGLEAARCIRSLEKKDGVAASRIPIVVLSAATLQKDVEQAMQAGVDDYLTKPVNQEQLLSVLKEILLN